MKIDENSINHNVTRLINDATTSLWELDSDSFDHERLIILGYIRGVIELAGELKAMLKE